VLGNPEGLVTLEKIQLMPELFGNLRALVSRPGQKACFIILGSASSEIIRSLCFVQATHVLSMHHGFVWGTNHNNSIA
jgi:hypothetical protein